MTEYSPNLVRATGLVTLIVFCSLAGFSAAEDDVRCLRGVKSSLQDPAGMLTSWNFGNNSLGFICTFAGVSCWNSRENRLISLELPSMELAGEVPSALKDCSSMQTLDLSGNRLSGPIPAQICEWLPFLVSIDLSNNDLSGAIPEEIVKCSYLNTIVFDGNQLTGGIPSQLTSLKRLKKFSVADNDLSGRVPSFAADVDLNVTGNAGLCGETLRKCRHG